MSKYLLLSAALLLIGISVHAQEVFNGVVKDNNGKPVPSTIVAIKGTKINTETDTSGVFSLSGKFDYPFTLLVTSIGYKPKEIQIYELQDTPFEIKLYEDGLLSEVVVTSRRRQEDAQAIPIPVSVIAGSKAEDAGAFNVNRLKELVPSVQLYSSNPRNTTLNIRGLGSTFGLTNDGIEPGVGFYVDGVYHARPAATTMDFIDIEQIEILRGPQGTLFGKNTTAGAFNIITKRPSSIPSGKAEVSYGNYNFVQAKASFTGGLAKNLSARLSFSGTDRQGTIFNEKQQQYYNGLNNIGIKGQLLYSPIKNLDILVSGDYNIQRPDGYALVVADIIETKRSAHQQYYKIVDDLGYARPVVDPFSRRTEADSPWKHHQELGGAHLNIDYKIGKATLTSTTAWRFWNWDPVNDRDFTAIPALAKSQASSRHDQLSQEVRLAGNIFDRVNDYIGGLSGVVGVFYLDQTLKTPVSQLEEVGSAEWRFRQTSTVPGQANWGTPGLLDGYGTKTDFVFKTRSAAVFAQADLEIIKGLHIQPGIRYNYDTKDLDFSITTYGGLQTTVPGLLTRKRSVYADQKFISSTTNTNVSGNITVSYRPNDFINAYATFSTNYKSVGLNLGQLPPISSTNSDPNLDLAVIKPEYVQHYELGIKTKPIKGSILNVSVYNTDIRDYQTTVQVPTVTRGYIANAAKVNVKGFEVDAAYQFGKVLSINAAVAYTDGKYVDFKNAPLPLEETGKLLPDANGVVTVPGFADASGGRLPGISKWNFSGGIDLSTKGKLFERAGRFFIASDVSFRTDYSSNPTPSTKLNINGYSLVNARLGFRSDAFTFFIWSRNLANTNYFEQLQAASGNYGLIAGVLGDPRTFGATVRVSF